MQLMWVPSYSHTRTEKPSGTNTNMCISAKLEKAVFTDGCNTFRKFLIMSRLCQNMGWAQNNPAEKTSDNFCAGPSWFYMGRNRELIKIIFFNSIDHFCQHGQNNPLKHSHSVSCTAIDHNTATKSTTETLNNLFSQIHKQMTLVISDLFSTSKSKTGHSYDNV